MGFGAKSKPQSSAAPIAPAASLEAPTVDGPVTNATSAILQRKQLQQQANGWQSLVIPLGSSASMSSAVTSAGSGVSIPVAAAPAAAAPSTPSTTSLAIRRRRGRQSEDGGANVEMNGDGDTSSGGNTSAIY
jgi:hypothetical protein